jgi:hypothetical protein
MAPRTGTRRRGRRKATAQTTNGQTATALLTQVTQLVDENRALTRENQELHTILARIGQTVQKLTIRPISSAQRRTVAGQATPAPARARRQRRRVTDPAALERRRAALAKARQVLAAKRAAEKSSKA